MFLITLISLLCVVVTIKAHPHHHPDDTSPVISRDSTAFAHASYLNPNYEFEEGFRSQLSSFGFDDDEDDLGACQRLNRRSVECSGNEQYRSYDGSCNNLNNPTWGQAGLPYRRYLPPNLAIGDFQCGRRNTNLPSPRLASLNLVRRGNRDRHVDLSNFVMLWGQMIDHDILITPVRMTRNGDFLDCCHPLNANHGDCCPVRSSSDDPFFGASHRPKCQSMLRSRKTPGVDCGAKDVENGNSVYIDGSSVYGSTEERALLLREMSDGKLKVSVDKFNRHFPPVTETSTAGISMEFGDARGDSTLASTMLITVWIRNHNVLAKGLKKLHPRWNDEKLYQEARKINGALMQHITYNEYLDKILGSPNNLRVNEREGHRDSYNPSIDATAKLEFADAGFRLHTSIGSFSNIVDANYRIRDKILLRDVFRTPMKIVENSTYDDLIRGSVIQPLREFNNVYSPEMTEWMFRKGSNDFGLDIVAITIQRGRDHKLPGYVAYREKCGLGRVRRWEDLTDLIPGDIVNRIRRTYRNVQDIDLDVGVIVETAVFGAEVGPTMHCMIRDQFKRLKDGDRFFYTRPGIFTRRQLRAIKSVKLADVLCGNSDDRNSMALPRDVFRVAHPRNNPIFRCFDHLQFDIEAWRDA